MLFFVGESLTHFGEGIKDILNKEEKEEEDEDYVYHVAHQKEGVLLKDASNENE